MVLRVPGHCRTLQHFEAMGGRQPWRLALAAAALTAGVLDMGPTRLTNFLQDHLEESGDKVQRALRPLMQASFMEPTMDALRVILLESTTTKKSHMSNYELVGSTLAAYMLARTNRRSSRKNLPLVRMPAHLQALLGQRNVVAEIRSKRGNVSLATGLVELQLHNVLSEHDPFNETAAKWYAVQVAKLTTRAREDPGLYRSWQYALLRTCLLGFSRRSPEMLAYFDKNGLLHTPGDLTRFIVEYDGPLGDILLRPPRRHRQLCAAQLGPHAAPCHFRGPGDR